MPKNVPKEYPRKSIKVIVEFFLIIAFIIGIYIFFGFFAEQDDKIEVHYSKTLETKLGALLKKEISKTFPIIENEKITNDLTLIQNRLISNISEPKFHYEVIIVHSNTPNAYALPGGYIYFTTEILKLFESPEEFASVLSHEIAHHEKNHHRQRLISQIGLQAVSILLGNPDQILTKEILYNLISSVFSRSQEEAADNFAIRLLVNSSIKPYHLASAFRKLKTYSQNQQKDYNNIEKNLQKINEVFSSHPIVDERIKNIFNIKLKESFIEKPIPINWLEIQKEIKKEISKL